MYTIRPIRLYILQTNDRPTRKSITPTQCSIMFCRITDSRPKYTIDKGTNQVAILIDDHRFILK